MKTNNNKFRALALGCAIATLGGGAALYAAPATSPSPVITSTVADTVPTKPDTTRPRPDTTMPPMPPRPDTTHPRPDTTHPRPDTTHHTPAQAIKPF